MPTINAVSLGLDTLVTVVKDEQLATCKIRELQIGQEFCYDNRLYRLDTKRVPVGSCRNGSRVCYLKGLARCPDTRI